MATAAAPGEADRSLSIGRVFGLGFGTLGSNPLATFGIAFLFGALPSLLVGLVVQSYRFELVSRIGLWATVALGLVTVVLGILFAMITQGALVRATVAHSEGRRAGIGESAVAGLRVVVPLFLLGLLSALGIALGLILLLIPGIILYVIWSVAAPALVEERLGPVEALGRSRRLTDGARWKIFGLQLILLVAYWLFSALTGVVILMWYGSPQQFVAAAAAGSVPLGYMLFSTVVQTLVSAVWGVIQTALYVELRRWKDGPAVEALADVFG